MKTVLMHSPNDLDGVSLYRHWGPMIQLEKQGHVKLIAMHPDLTQVTNWQYYKKADFAFISRPYRLQDSIFIKECKKHGLPIWIDIDDNLFVIPDDNDAFLHFGNETAKGIIFDSLKKADVVSVATSRFKEFLSREFQLNATLLSNGLSQSDLKNRMPFRHVSQITWRGSKSHITDLLYFEKEILHLMESRPKAEWVYMGLNPFFISRKFPKPPIKWFQLTNYIDYIREICHHNSTFAFAALIDSEFNRTRSANGWMESTLAGSVFLAPDWESWQYPGITHYSTRGDFVEKFKDLLDCYEHDLINKHKLSWEYIVDNLLLDNINKLRLEIINNLGRS